ncbi:hypothetical protein LTR37_004937 [Vermiconidia calcicola]|uniref:Uncharacterized protein n=1 Tax=Vermiconidia calcicola TaxID=1690605 RepID=A0ACC3NM20_9PEZI|nr:hypothetical protein LTR37_004937 [Vermiconidia calcicola]
MPRDVSRAWKWYRQGWYRGPEWRRIRAEYNNDQDAYLNAYRARPEDLDYSRDIFLTSGMKCFTAWQARLTGQLRRESYWNNGQKALQALTSALRAGQPPSKDYVFVAINFEGTAGPREVTELGVSSFDTKQMFDDAHQTVQRLSIHDEHFRLARRRSRKFMFGNTTRITPDMLPEVLRGIFAFYQDKCPDGVIIVGHGLWDTEIREMDRYGVTIESLPAVVGTIDTAYHYQLCSDERGGPCGRLSDLLSAYHIPCRPESLHCAGNDAHYTLRLVLALMLKKLVGMPACAYSRVEAVQELIARPLPIPPAYLRVRYEEDDWQQYLDDNLGIDPSLDLANEGA